MNEQNEDTTPATEPTPEELSANLAAIREKLGLTNDGEPITHTENDTPKMGSDVDWSIYDLDAKIAHLYSRAQYVPTPDGPKWIVMLDDFAVLRAPYEVLGGEIANLVNGPEGWRLQSAVVPAGAVTRAQAKRLGGLNNPHGPAGVVTLQRKVRIALPMPNLLKTEEEDAPAPVTTEELKASEDAALAWVGAARAESDATAPNTGDTIPVMPPALDERGPAEQSVIPGAIAAAEDAARG